MAAEPAVNNCPSCDTSVPARTSLCPSCGFRLVATSDAQVLLGLLHGPDTAHPGPGPLTSAPAEFLPTELIPIAPPRFAPEPGHQVGRSRASRWPAVDGVPRRVLVGAGLALLIVVGAGIAISSLAGGLGSGGRKATAAPSPTIVTLRPVDPTGISASASSTLHPESRGYQARNTLDGRDDTAWNANGDKDGRGVGVTLTWSFDQPRHIMAITVRNGYVRSRKDADVFDHNGRIKRVRITSGPVSTEWTLKDTPAPQALKLDLGTTSSVRFEVVEIYQGSKYKDLALTDIVFDAAG